MDWQPLCGLAQEVGAVVSIIVTSDGLERPRPAPSCDVVRVDGSTDWVASSVATQSYFDRSDMLVESCREHGIRLRLERWTLPGAQGNDEFNFAVPCLVDALTRTMRETRRPAYLIGSDDIFVARPKDTDLESYDVGLAENHESRVIRTCLPYAPQAMVSPTPAGTTFAQVWRRLITDPFLSNDHRALCAAVMLTHGMAGTRVAWIDQAVWGCVKMPPSPRRPEVTS